MKMPSPWMGIITDSLKMAMEKELPHTIKMTNSNMLEFVGICLNLLEFSNSNKFKQITTCWNLLEFENSNKF